MEKIMEFIEKKWLAIGLVLILTALAYSNIFSNQFVWDDPDFYKNWPALYSWKSLPDLLTGEVPIQHIGVYRPVRSLFQLILFQTFGAKNILGYHFVSLFIHLLATLLVYLIAEKLSAKKLVAFLTAIFFGLQPIHTEAITYITTSIDEIGIVFALASILLYLHFQKNDNKIFYFISVAASVVAFFTYEAALITPLLLILIDLYKSNFDWKKIFQNLKLYWLYFGGIILWIVAKISFAPQVRALSYGADISLANRLLTMGIVVLKYIYLLIFPKDLNVYHKIDFAKGTEPSVILAWLAVMGLLILTLTLAKKYKNFSLAMLWFFICILPFSNIIPTGIIMAEKYLYLASFSLCLFLAIIIEKLFHQQKKNLQALGLILVALISISYGSVTYARNFDWQDNKTLWEKTLIKRPDYGRVYNNLGFIYYQQKDYQKALEYFDKAAELEPNLPIIYHNFGNVYDELNDLPKAIANFNKAIELKLDSAETYNNLGIVYQKNNDLPKAIESYQKSIEIDKLYFRSYSNLGLIYIEQQDYSRAEKNFKKSLEINPNFALALHGLAVTLVNQEKIDEAIPYYQKSIQNDPYIIDNYNHLGSIYSQQKNYSAAIDILKKGLEAFPEDPELHTNLAIVLANYGQLDSAKAELEAALTIDPNFALAKQLLQKITEKK